MAVSRSSAGGRKSTKCQEWLAPAGVASPLVEGAAYQLTAAGDLFVFTPTTGRFVGADTAVVTAFDAADKSTWETQPCGTGLQIEAIGECAVITDGDASVDGLADGTAWEGDYYTMPLTALNEALRSWSQSLAGTSTTPGGGDETTLAIPGGATLVPFSSTAHGVDPTGIDDSTFLADGIGQVAVMDAVTVYGKPGELLTLSLQRAGVNQFDAVVLTGADVPGNVIRDFGHTDANAALPDAIELQFDINTDPFAKSTFSWWIFDASGNFRLPFAPEQNGLLFSTTEQNTLTVEVYRINDALYGKLPVAFDYQGAGELPAGTYVPLQDGQATWCCGCETDLLTEANTTLTEIRDKVEYDAPRRVHYVLNCEYITVDEKVANGVPDQTTAVVVVDPTGTYAVGDVIDTSAMEPFDPKQPRKSLTLTAVTTALSTTIRAPFTKLMVQSTSGTTTVNGWEVDEGDEWSVAADAWATEFVNDHIIESSGARYQVVRDATIRCARDGVHEGLKVGVTTTINAGINDTICDDPANGTYSVLSATNCTAVHVGDGLFDVTPDAVACGATWEFEYEVTCDGRTGTAIESGLIVDTPVSQQLAVTNSATVNLGIVLSGGSTYDIAWGDGNTSLGVASSTSPNATHTYASAFTGNITITHSSCEAILEIDSTQGGFSFNIEEFFAANTTLQKFEVRGDTQQLTGNIEVAFASTPGLIIFNTSGNLQQITGDIGVAFALVTGLTLFSAGGSLQQLTGNIEVAFASTVGLTFFSAYGNLQQLTGDIGVAFALVTGLTFFSAYGNLQQLSGNIETAFASTSGLTYFNSGGDLIQYTGDIAAAILLVPSLSFFGISGALQNLSVSAAPAFPTTFRYFLAQSALTQAEVDFLLVGGQAVTTWTNEKLFNVGGNNAAPSATGTAAAAVITSNGATVTTN